MSYEKLKIDVEYPAELLQKLKSIVRQTRSRVKNAV